MRTLNPRSPFYLNYLAGKENFHLIQVTRNSGTLTAYQRVEFSVQKMGFSLVKILTEIAWIKERFCSTDLAGRRVIIISGQVGTGKSYLYNKVVCEVRRTYNKKKWLCYSKEIDLNRDISSISPRKNVRIMWKVRLATEIMQDITIRKPLTKKKSVSKGRTGSFQKLAFFLGRCSFSNS